MTEIRRPLISKGFSGASLKWIAIMTMLIDHITAVFVPIESSYYLPGRMIGRLAFPLFCFLIVEGFFHTSNRRKYASRLGLFALISELPFDLAFYQTPFYWGHQNVYFTLSIGLLALTWFDYFRQKSQVKAFLGLLFFIILADLLKTDYGAYGIAFIYSFYAFYPTRNYQAIVGALLGLVQNIFASLSMIFVAFYNGQRGWQPKYFFYIFYPGHLLVLALINSFLK